jgi:hypothetical protein
MEKIGFGHCWDLIGKIEGSSVEAMVEKIIADEYLGEETNPLKVWLSDMQMTNLGTNYGPLLAINNFEVTRLTISRRNTERNYLGRKIYVSEQLAQTLNLEVNEIFFLKRVLDLAGRVKYDSEREFRNPFGRGKNPLDQPLIGSVTQITDSYQDWKFPRIGLTKNQFKNLSIDPENKKTRLTLEHGKKELIAKPCLINDQKRKIGCGILVSESAAYSLDLYLGDSVFLTKIE